MEKKDSSTHGHGRKVLWWTLGIVIVAVAALGAWAYCFLSDDYSGEPVRVHIPAGASEAAVKDSLVAALGQEMGSDVFMVWKAKGGKADVSEGSYRIKDGMSVLDIGLKIANGRQDPVKVVFNNVRTMDQLAEKIAAKMEFSAGDFLSICDSVLPSKGFTPEQYSAAFLPDTYEFYWSASPRKVVERMLAYRDNFWNEKRRGKAAAIGLTPEEVSVVASIVEEETAKTDERPKVARLYLNRLGAGMKLQADPTVKFAMGDFTVRRLLHSHLDTDSPYNTYMYEGLPPGPIRVVEKSTIDAVLNAPAHDYLYMCAREDFSGYHNFSETFAEHKTKANRYRNELNRRHLK